NIYPTWYTILVELAPSAPQQCLISSQRMLAYSPLYQLAFVLDTQIYLVQAKLFIEIIFLLQYELEHYGNDFTLQFKWLHNEQ
ncbi:hypothetical protein F441_09728, partial [Phytophthora nicotianae CJ01A1]